MTKKIVKNNKKRRTASKLPFMKYERNTIYVQYIYFISKHICACLLSESLDDLYCASLFL